ncbi:hypothetical protein LTR27_000182 [Elasticomyces elasticus]|nr:hypothetical protein LTR27_000182 [Elasticomyces elasticus]
MAEHTIATISGLREQIKANAAVLFPDVTTYYSSIQPHLPHIPAAVWFEIVALEFTKTTDDGVVTLHQASLAHRHYNRYTQDAVGKAGESVVVALENLLSLTANALSTRMATLCPNEGVKWQAVGGGLLNEQWVGHPIF